MDSGANNSGPDGHSRETMRARLGVRDSLSTNFHPTHSLRGFRERARGRRRHITMDATDDHRRRPSDGRWENTFIFTLHD